MALATGQINMVLVLIIFGISCFIFLVFGAIFVFDRQSGSVPFGLFTTFLLNNAAEEIQFGYFRGQIYVLFYVTTT